MESLSPHQPTPQVHYRDRWACWKREEVLLSSRKAYKENTSSLWFPLSSSIIFDPSLFGLQSSVSFHLSPFLHCYLWVIILVLKHSNKQSKMKKKKAWKPWFQGLAIYMLSHPDFKSLGETEMKKMKQKVTLESDPDYHIFRQSSCLLWKLLQDSKLFWRKIFLPISQNYETAICKLSFEKLFGLKQTKSIKKLKISSLKAVFKHVIILLII